jgi:hypothetical protein
MSTIALPTGISVQDRRIPMGRFLSRNEKAIIGFRDDLRKMA